MPVYPPLNSAVVDANGNCTIPWRNFFSQLALGGGGTGGGLTPGSVTTSILADNSVTDAKLRDSVGTSVIGRSAATTGDPADIVAGADQEILGRRANVLGFTEIQDFGYWSPLTNGSVASPEIVFDGSGDTIAVWTATP